MAIRQLAALGAAAVVLLTSAPRPGAALHTLGTTSTAADATAPLLALVALVAWALLGWLLVVAAAALAARLPGLAGRVGGFVAARVAPAAVRRIVEVALGLTVAAGVLGASPASAGSALPPAPPAASASLDWPTPPATLEWNPPIAPVAARPAPAPLAPAPALIVAPPAPAVLPPASARPAAVVVRPGDSLWSVAADHLPASATDALIARAWPSWWAANRDAVGADPDLITPGLQLTPPAHTPSVQH